MSNRLPKIVGLAALLLTLGSAGVGSNERPATLPSVTLASTEAVAGFNAEVRLRRLHLVRPDLIPYPLYFEVNC